MMKTRDYFKRVETQMDKLRPVGGLVSKKMFSRIFRNYSFSLRKKYQLSKKKIIDTYIRYKLFSFGINGFSYT